jgi:hypothetical protein
VDLSLSQEDREPLRQGNDDSAQLGDADFASRRERDQTFEETRTPRKRRWRLRWPRTESPGGSPRGRRRATARQPLPQRTRHQGAVETPPTWAQAESSSAGEEHLPPENASAEPDIACARDRGPERLLQSGGRPPARARSARRPGGGDCGGWARPAGPPPSRTRATPMATHDGQGRWAAPHHNDRTTTTELAAGEPHPSSAPVLALSDHHA